MKIKRIGLIALGVWLILQGLPKFINFSFSGLDTVMAVLAIVAGILVMIDK